MPQQPTIAMLTAGAGGMFCGSCIHDNALAAALQKQSVDAILIPTYTPIRTDEESVSIDQVFFGGINVFLQQKFPWLSRFPRWMDRWLDNPRLLRWVASRNMETDASQLGDLTLSMLRGVEGQQRKEVQRLADWLSSEIHPDLIVFSNILIAGSAAALKAKLKRPILITLQGDDVFLKDLPDDVRTQAIAEINRIAEHVDGFLTHSRFYADFMAEYLSLPREKFHVIPLGLNVEDWSNIKPVAQDKATPPTIGYLARMAPEKGLHLLCEAFELLKQREATANVRLQVAGWVGSGQAYADECIGKLQNQFGRDVRFEPEISRERKLAFFSEIDVLSVPCTWHEPKGIYVLESLAAGVPVVQPDHGAFPELIQSTGGGELFTANNVESLADTLARLLTDEALARNYSQQGRAAVMERHSAAAAARSTLETYQQFLR